LAQFRDAEKKYIVATRDQSGGSVFHKTSNLDVAALLAANHGLAEDGQFGPQDSWVLATFLALKVDFANRYPVNAGKLFPLFGRYPEDRYNGVSLNPQPFEQGNPWFLTTFAASEVLSRAATAFQRKGAIRIDRVNVEFFNDLLRGPALAVKPDNYFRSADSRFWRIISQLLRHAKGYLDSAEQHWGSQYSMAEQMDRNTGFMVGVEHLSWSYASWLSAQRNYESARKLFVGATKSEN
jgi:glucoamylase